MGGGPNAPRVWTILTGVRQPVITDLPTSEWLQLVFVRARRTSTFAEEARGDRTRSAGRRAAMQAISNFVRRQSEEETTVNGEVKTRTTTNVHHYQLISSSTPATRLSPIHTISNMSNQQATCWRCVGDLTPSTIDRYLLVVRSLKLSPKIENRRNDENSFENDNNNNNVAATTFD